MKNTNQRNLILAALFLAIGLIFPLVTGHLPQMGRMFLPMHIPVLLCGFFCGGPLGLVVGLVLPLLQSLFFGMPPLYPVAIAMTFELAAYGFVSGLLYRALPKKPQFIYVSLITAMLIGRAVSGIANYMLYSLNGTTFTWKLFLMGAFTTAIPGIVIQLIFIPVIVFALQKAKLIEA